MIFAVLNMESDKQWCKKCRHAPHRFPFRNDGIAPPHPRFWECWQLASLTHLLPWGGASAGETALCKVKGFAGTAQFHRPIHVVIERYIKWPEWVKTSSYLNLQGPHKAMKCYNCITNFHFHLLLPLSCFSMIPSTPPLKSQLSHLCQECCFPGELTCNSWQF